MGEFQTIGSYRLQLAPADGSTRTVRLRGTDGTNSRIRIGGKHVRGRAAPLAGHAGRLCRLTRWKEIAATAKLRDERAPERETGPRLSAVPMPRLPRYASGAATAACCFAAAAGLVAVPFLQGLVTGALAGLLGAVSGGLTPYALPGPGFDLRHPRGILSGPIGQPPAPYGRLAGLLGRVLMLRASRREDRKRVPQYSSP